MKIMGSCFCGAIVFEAQIDENRIGLCHCRDWQRFSGSAFRTFGAARPEDFAFKEGTPKYSDKTGDSGGTRRQAFCGTSGTRLASMPGDREDVVKFVTVRVALSEQFKGMTPVVEIFCGSRLPWQKPLDGTKQFARMPSARILQ